jgi:micrococcal nuclease
MKQMYNYNIDVIRVIDGDTIDCFIDLGFNVSIKSRIRLHGINTPETRTKNIKEKHYGIEAKLKLFKLLEEKEVTMVSHGIGKFGRVLGVLYVDDVNINEILVKEGYAVEYGGGKKMEIDELLEHLDKVKENASSS